MKLKKSSRLHHKNNQVKNKKGALKELTALNRLSAVVAHEIRNPLSTIRGSAELVNESIPESSPAKKYISYIIKEVDRLNRVVNEILFFGRPPRPICKCFDLNAVIEELCQGLGTSDFSRYNVNCIKKLGGGLPSAWADPDLIKQVLFNLMQNACQSMEHSQTKELTLSTFSDMKNIYIEIKDTGSGIEPENTKKIFMPFFTTKSKGTGLGLVVSKNIIESHGGRITVKSEPGKGAAFLVSLPVNPV